MNPILEACRAVCSEVKAAMGQEAADVAVEVINGKVRVRLAGNDTRFGQMAGDDWNGPQDTARVASNLRMQRKALAVMRQEYEARVAAQAAPQYYRDGTGARYVGD